MQAQVAIQGVRTSFHDIAARRYFGERDLSILPCQSFHDVCNALVTNRSAFALMAIENSIVGPLHDNYLLLAQYPMHIVGELQLPIHHHLMALPGTSLRSIRQVLSHPVALRQCTRFLKAHPRMQSMPSVDTAASAHEIATNRIAGAAAIASREAAAHHGLQIIAENIGDRQDNYTRFLVLSVGARPVPNPDKAIVNFICANPTALSTELSVMVETSGCTLSMTTMPRDDGDGALVFAEVTCQAGSIPDQLLVRMARTIRGMRIMGQYQVKHQRV
ncbi:MAG: prephenate dehydratase domain-containing protein [Saprospiraceae bacterium]|nr:prephenate dehydratase domain-containing protein [Saprospiraceae bacterium]